MKDKPCIAVVSPFLDKSFGTERIVVEWISRLVDAFEIHIYSQKVQDIDLSKITWHRIPKIPKPHLLNFIWWFAANHIWRIYDRHFRGLQYELVFTPGINCFDADVISIHIVFAEYVRRLHSELRFKRNPPSSWIRLSHRKLYYRLLIFLEGHIYTNRRLQLILTSKRTAQELERFYGRRDQFPVIGAALDHQKFNPGRRQLIRKRARQELGLADGQFVILLIGNDWRKKGLPAVLKALTLIHDLSIEFLLVSRESPSAHRSLFDDYSLRNRIHFLPPRKDVEFYYAAADAYIGPSIEDTFALPVIEAMACGLPVVTSSRAGASDIITDGSDGLILQDPTDSSSLAAMIKRLYEDEPFRRRLGEKAVATTAQYTWEQNGVEVTAILKETLHRKPRMPGPLAQES